MKIVLTCGHPNSGFQAVHDALSAAGLAAAKPSRQEALSPAEYYDKMFRAHDQDPGGLGTNAQLSPGKVWQELAVDLFLANMAQDAWGWADSRTIWTLDFWAAFDSQTRFVLVYSSPEFAVGQGLRGKAATRDATDRLIDAWTVSNLELMRFYNRHPDRCVLVNAAASLDAPVKLVAEIANRLDINMALSDFAFQVDRNGVSAIASSLTRALIEDCDEANALYRELESAADIDSGSITPSAQEGLQAWKEYASLVAAVTDEAAAASENKRLAALLQVEIENSNYQLAMVTEQHGTERNKHAETVANLNAQIEQFNVKLGEFQYALAAAQSETPRLQNINAELTQENELMRLQLHQMQDELEQLSRQNQELLDRAPSASALDEMRDELERLSRQNRELLDPAPSAPAIDQRQDEPEQLSRQDQELLDPAPSAPARVEDSPAYRHAEAFVDMTGPIDGRNWYYAEHDGRWAGPHHTGTIRMPALRDGNYEMCLDIVDAQSPEILSGMEVALNGLPLGLVHDGEGVIALVYAQFSTNALAKNPVWEFQFKFPKLVAPSDHGSDDVRILAIRLKSLKLVRRPWYSWIRLWGR